MVSITREVKGKTGEGKELELYTFKNKNGMTVTVTNMGAAIVNILAPDKNGKTADVVLGFDDLKQYVEYRTFYGATVGRHANRIAGAAFTINGETYHVTPTIKDIQLHGGPAGFDRKLWSTSVVGGSEKKLMLTYFSPDLEEGFPGNLQVTLLYSLNDCNEFTLEYFARSDKDTVVNLTNHSFFNLGGHDSGKVLSHELWMDSDFYAPNYANGIPTGEILAVEGTPFDFRKPKAIGRDIESGHPQLVACGGYDHNYVLKTKKGAFGKVAEVVHPESGRRMTVSTDQPGVQLYTGNFLNGANPGKNGLSYNYREAFCLETQYFPNSTGYSHFTDAVLKADELYHYTTVYGFDAVK